MHASTLATQRLLSQQLTTPMATSVAQVVQWMGAMQAQDYNMAKWAIGVRLPGSTDRLVENAINQADIIRTHLLRPTWHFVAATDIYWMLELTAPNIKKLIAGMNRKLELDDTCLQRSNAIIEKALEGHVYLTRDELMERLQGAGIKTDELRSVHLMFNAELAGLVCNGPRRDNLFTYALLRERVPVCHQLSREDALAALASRYFTSHGPATLRDFVWWSGLTITDARKGLELVKSQLVSITSQSQVYWLAEQRISTQPMPEQIHLLPAFDEFLISYCDRSASLSADLVPNPITVNGIFKPIIVIDGQVVGVWKRTVKPKTVAVDLIFASPLPDDLIKRIRLQVTAYARYLQTSFVVTH